MKPTTTTTNQNSFTPESLKAYAKRNAPFQALAIITLAILFSGKIEFYGLLHRTSQASLTDFAACIRFVIQQQTLGLTWLLFSLLYVIYYRVTSPALDPMSGNEKYVEAAQKNLTNSLEQLVMSFMAQLILVTHLSAAQIVQLIPVVNIAFFVGRVTFWLGYPSYRSAGIILTAFPTWVMIVFNFYMFIIS